MVNDNQEKSPETFDEFYEYYLSAHRNVTSLRLHFAGTTIFIMTAIFANIFFFKHAWMILAPVALVGYGMAWFGHYAFEKNKPATFGNPLWSAKAGVMMYIQMLTGRISLSSGRVQ